MQEIWKSIKGFEGIYEVSNLGNVKSLGNDKAKKEKILKNCLNDATGYLQVCLSKNGKNKVIRVHQLVAIAFLNHKPDGYKGLIIDHIDNDKLNNTLDNLQLITNRLNLSKDKKGSSKFTGVSWSKRSNKWQSSIVINGKQKYLGLFVNELEASKVYQKALKELTIN